MWTPLGVSLWPSSVSELVVSPPFGGQDFSEVSAGTPVADIPSWSMQPGVGDATDLVASDGAATTGGTPTSGDVPVYAPTIGTSNKLIQAVIADVTEQVAILASHIADSENFLGVQFNPNTGTLDLLQKRLGVTTTLTQAATAFNIGDLFGLAIFAGFATITRNGLPLTAPTLFASFFTNQGSGIVVRNPLGVAAPFISSITWSGVQLGYGYSYGLSYGN